MEAALSENDASPGYFMILNLTNHKENLLIIYIVAEKKEKEYISKIFSKFLNGCFQNFK